MKPSLDYLLAAYRAEPVDDGAAKATRARILAGHARRTRTRLHLRLSGWVAGALLCGSSAMAAVTSGSQLMAQVAALFSEPAQADRRAEVPRSKQAPATHGEEPARAVPQPQPAVATPSLAGPPPASAVGRTPPQPTRTSHLRKARIPPSNAMGSAGDDADLSAFGHAHALHFAQADPRSAIAAWSSYLARFPRGRFVLEARYNRAIAYVRAGDAAAARAALTEFAEGEHDGYRQREARALLRALPRAIGTR